MIYNVLQYLERAAEAFSEKIALEDESESLTYAEYESAAKKIGCFIIDKTGGKTGQPIVVLIDRNIRSIAAFMGIVYSGNFYVPVDTSMPEERVGIIYDTLKPILTIDARKEDKTGEFQSSQYTEILETAEIDEAALKTVRDLHIDVDPLYAIFTSGSTGVPKGVLVSHRSVIDLVNSFEEAFSFNSDNIFGNQAPFDFDVSVKDIYNALYTGAALKIVPKKLYKTPKLVVEYLREKKIDTLIWAVSALRIVSDFKALDGAEPLKLKNIMFSGEVMPVKSLNYWREKVPEARYVNLYGPTEITCNCTYYVIDREKKFNLDELIPIGRAFKNCRVFLKGDNGEIIVKPNEIGEITVEGTCLALGYWNNEEKTEAAFIKNPNITAYEMKVYASGDMGYYNEDNELIFASRRDHQIKHMGHRIELGEIEVALNSLPFITIACCTFDEAKGRITCHYEAGEECKKEIVMGLSKKLPKYMWPNVYRKYDALPMNKNGKIDRVALKNAAGID